MNIAPYFFVGIGSFALFMFLARIIARVFNERSIMDISNEGGVLLVLLAWWFTPLAFRFLFGTTSSEELMAFLAGYLLVSIVALFLSYEMCE